MVYEISQFDIPDRQLLEPEAQPKAGIWMDIGEARVTRTIFGRPRIRVICERDKKRRAWMLAGLAVILICAAGWQGWVALQRILNAPPPLPLSARIRVGPPVFDSEDFTPASRKQKTQTQILLEGMATHRPAELPEPQQPPVKAAGKIAAKPVNAPAANMPMAPLDAHNSSLADQAGMPQPVKLPPRLKARAAAASHAAQPAANKAAAVAPVAQPLVKEDAAAQPPAEDNQPPAPATTKP
jgi:hypothetical protein